MSEQALPDRSKENAAPAAAAAGAGAEGGAAAPSKNALKKAAKEKEKAEKAAKRKAQEQAQAAAAEANDVSKDDYGDLPLSDGTPAAIKGVTRANITKVAANHKSGKSNDGEEVLFRCVVVNARVQSAKLAFLMFRQGVSTIQAVVAASDTLSRQMVKFCGGLPTESTVLVQGLVMKPKEEVKSATLGWVEIHVKKLYCISRAEVLPIQVEDAERPLPVEGEEEAQKDGEEAARPNVALPTRLDNRVIDLKARQNYAIFRIAHGVQSLFRKFLEQRGFIEVHTPKLLGAATEGGASVFEVKYFDRKAYLAQSPQFYKQMLIAAGFKRVMEVGSVFRAENSNTARHLTEFMGLDLEMEFEEDYREVVDLLVEMLLFIFEGLQNEYAEYTELVRKVYQVPEFKLPASGNVPILPFSAGVQMLRDAGVTLDDFADLSTPDEKKLGQLVLEKYGTDFYVLDKFPLAARPFYTMPADTSFYHEGMPENAAPPHPWAQQYSNSYDFFMRGQEILSGAQRVHSASFLRKRMREHATPVNPDDPGLRDYVNAFRYGCPPHGGAGLGLDRIVMLWLGLPNIRLATLFPRDPSRLAP